MAHDKHDAAAGNAAADNAAASNHNAAERTAEASESAKKAELNIGLVLPDVLGTYGDDGNALVLRQRARMRGISAQIHPIKLGADPGSRAFACRRRPAQSCPRWCASFRYLRWFSAGRRDFPRCGPGSRGAGLN